MNGSRNVRFEKAVAPARGFGFTLLRVNDSHHIFQHPEVREAVNLQNVNGQAKPYQIKQLLRLVELYNLQLEKS